MPTLPPWDAMHPLIVHVPIGLLTVAPLPALLALLMPSRRILFIVLTFFVTLLGATGTVVATMSGEAAHESAHHRGLVTAAVHPVLEEHEELGETTRNTYLILTLLFAGAVIAAQKGKLAAGAGVAASAVMLVGTLGGLLLLAKTADLGGRLVHHYGVHAQMGPATGVPAVSPADHDGDHDDGD